MLGTQRQPTFTDEGDDLVARLTSYLEGHGSLAQVRAATTVISRALYVGALPPQRLITTLEDAIRAASARAGVHFGTPEFRAMHGELTLWLIEACFAGIDEFP